MSLPLVSVVSMVRNGMPYVAAAWKSVLAQTYSNIELVVSDASSTDGTLDVAEAVRKQAPFVVSVVSERDGGVADGYNRAVRRANGDYIALIEADNIFLPTYIETAMKCLLARPRLALVSTSQLIINAEGVITSRWTAPGLDLFGTLCQERVVPSGSTVKNRSLMGDDAHYTTDGSAHCCDYEFWARVAVKGYAHAALPDFVYATRLSDASGSCDLSRYRAFVEEKRAFARALIAPNEHASAVELATLALAEAGIIMWAAEMTWTLGAAYGESLAFAMQAARLYPNYPRIAAFVRDLTSQTRRNVAADIAAGTIEGLPKLRCVT